MNNQDEDSLSPPLVQKGYEDPWNKLFIDLDALKANYRYLKSQLPPGAVFFAVLKSDAYGHGIVEVGKTLSQTGCRHFAVESPQEGVQLRNEGITGEILLMNPIPSWMAELSVRHDLSISVIDHSILEPLEEAARQMGKICRIHLCVNIGLNRLGAAPSRILKIAKEASSRSHIELEGLFGQPRDTASAKQSFEHLIKIYEKLKSEDVAPDYLHFANSATFLAHPEVVADGVRLGILLYGALPPEQYREKPASTPVEPVMSLETELVQIRELSKGSQVGYRAEEGIKQDMLIGTIPLGYYHGLDRKISKSGYVLIRGKKAPFVGAISMNSSTVDITGIKDAELGDNVTIIGKQGNLEISVNELAEKSDTITAELMLRFGQSIARRYRISEEDVTSEVVLEQEKTDDIHIKYFQTENDLPEWINVYDIIHFLQAHLIPYDDPKDVIAVAVEYALSSRPGGKGFVLLATSNKKIIGVVVSVVIEKIGSIPENLIVYACVHRNYRRRGLGSRLLREAIDIPEGDVKMHVEKTNPALKLLKKIGFRDDFTEMRFLKGGK